MKNPFWLLLTFLMVGCLDGGCPKGQKECGDVPNSAPPVVLADTFAYRHPTPSGPYAVGTHTLHLIDQSRLETATEDPDDLRELMVQLFYPTNAESHAPAPIVEDEVAQIISARSYLMPLNFNTRVHTGSTFDVPMSKRQDRWPVLIYSHSYRGYRTNNQVLVEDLASQGYVVVTVSHTYSSSATLFPDGSLATSMIPDGIPDPTTEEILAGLDYNSALLTGVWVPDIIFVIDQLERLDRADPCTWLSGRLDLERLGIFGYSFGGAAAQQVCARDARCDAGLNIDGAFWGDFSAETNKPIMYLKSRRNASLTWEAVHDRLAGEGYSVGITDSTHRSFSMASLLAGAFNPEIDLGVLGFGEIDQERSGQIVRDYARAFMNTHVKGLQEPLLAGPSDVHPEVVFVRTVAGRAVGDISALGQVVVGMQEASIVEGIAVTMANDRAATHTDHRGRWRLDGVPADTTFEVGFSHPEIFPTLAQLYSSGRFVRPGVLPLFRPDEMERLAGQAQTILDPHRGQVALKLTFCHNYHPVGPAASVIVSIDSGEDPVYLDGWTAIFNIEPGRHDLVFKHESLICSTRNAMNQSNTAEIVVVAGHVTELMLYCQTGIMDSRSP